MRYNQAQIKGYAAQLQGKYYYAPTAADVGPAFQGIQNQIIRLTQ